MKWRIDGVGSGAICTGMQPLLFANVHIFLWIMYAMPSSHSCSLEVCYYYLILFLSGEVKKIGIAK